MFCQEMTVKLHKVYGSEKSIADAAAMSRGNIEGYPGDTKAFIRKLLEWGHMSPFEFARMEYRVKVPIYVARQWMRHRTASIVEMSRRYTKDNIEFYVKDGILGEELMQECAMAVTRYKRLVEGEGVAPEDARAILPINTMTAFAWNIDIRNLLHFLELRMSPSAQAEIRECAKKILADMKDHFPTIHAWFVEKYKDKIEAKSKK